jgi:hypothetical protein
MSPSRKRPGVVTTLALAVLLLAVINLAGVFVAVRRWPVYEVLDLSLPLWVLTVFRAVWGLAWLTGAWGLWRMASWARRGMVVALPLYLLLVLGQQAVFVRGDYERGQLSFLAGISILSAALVAFILTRKRIRQAFERPSGRLSIDHPTNHTAE